MVSAFAAWYNALAGIAASNHTYVLCFLFSWGVGNGNGNGNLLG
jgi:hypothetical protein